MVIKIRNKGKAKPAIANPNAAIGFAGVNNR
jgi:hypothetical protein